MNTVSYQLHVNAGLGELGDVVDGVAEAEDEPEEPVDEDVLFGTLWHDWDEQHHWQLGPAATHREQLVS